MIVDEMSIPEVSFTYLGFEFKARDAKTKKGRTFPAFLPGISKKSLKKANEKIREKQISRRTGSTLSEIQEELNIYIRGFINYFGKFYKSATYRFLHKVDWLITKWVRNKYRKTKKEAYKWLRALYKSNNEYFVHWQHIKPRYAKGLEQ
jgi:RNA-directed DNA polymerase